MLFLRPSPLVFVLEFVVVSPEGEHAMQCSCYAHATRAPVTRPRHAMLCGGHARKAAKYKAGKAAKKAVKQAAKRRAQWADGGAAT